MEMTGWVKVMPCAAPGISLTLTWPSVVGFTFEGCKGLAFEELVVVDEGRLGLDRGLPFRILYLGIKLTSCCLKA